MDFIDQAYAEFRKHDFNDLEIIKNYRFPLKMPETAFSAYRYRDSDDTDIKAIKFFGTAKNGQTGAFFVFPEERDTIAAQPNAFGVSINDGKLYRVCWGAKFGRYEPDISKVVSERYSGPAEIWIQADNDKLSYKWRVGTYSESMNPPRPYRMAEQMIIHEVIHEFSTGDTWRAFANVSNHFLTVEAKIIFMFENSYIDIDLRNELVKSAFNCSLELLNNMADKKDSEDRKRADEYINNFIRKIGPILKKYK
jgi:hypothetical protein